MSVTDVALFVFLLLLSCYAIYDEFVMNLVKGETVFKIHLKRTNKLDSLIFIGLIAMLIYNNITLNGSALTRYLLLGMALLAVYIFYIRCPKLLFKKAGFFYANVFILYDRIKNITLSENGTLLIDLEKRQLFIHVKDLDELEGIYRFLWS